MRILASAFAAAVLVMQCVYAQEPVSAAVETSEGTASRSKLVWAGDGVVTNGIVSFCRHSFSLPAKPEKAALDTYLDDDGQVFINGREVPSRGDVTALLKRGANTIAVRVENAVSTSAMIYLVSCEDEYGNRFYVHSGTSLKGTVKPQPEGWEQPDFDDSGWPNVKVCADVLGKPWALYYDLKNRFTTRDERARLAKLEAPLMVLPKGIEDEPDPAVRVVYRGNQPKIEVNGRQLDAVVNICNPGDSYRDSAIVRCAEAGFGIVELRFVMERFCDDEGAPIGFGMIDEAVRRVLGLCPEAYVVLGLDFRMNKWAERHPSEQAGGASSRRPRPSVASDAYRDQALRVMQEFAEFANAKPWAKRVVGIRPLCAVYTEWVYGGMIEAPDTGERMRERFRAFMKARRGVENAEIPSALRCSKDGALHDPAEDGLVLDYLECHADAVADFVLALAGEARRLFPGRLVGVCHGGLCSRGACDASGAPVDRVIESPDVDFISNPPFADARARLPGGGFAPRTSPATLRRLGKFLLVEDDSRFHHLSGWLKGSQNLATKTELETEMNVRRNWLNQFFDGDGIQLCDSVKGVGERPNAFDDPAVFKGIADAKAALRKAGVASFSSGNTVAVVTSPRERLRMDGRPDSPFTRLVCQQPFIDICRSGAAFDMLSLEDYLANPRGYKTVVFLDAFYLTAEERAALKKLTRKPCVTSVWIGPAGGVTDAGFDDAAMSDLTGVAAAGIARRPRIVCRDGAAKPVCDGKAYSKTLAAGGRSIVVPEMPKSPSEYASILKEAGAWLYTTPGSYFRRYGDIFMLHTGTIGRHTIRLPRKRDTVRELFTDAKFASSVVTVETSGPATWLFRIER